MNLAEKLINCEKTIDAIESETEMKFTTCMDVDLTDHHAALTAYTRNEAISPVLLQEINLYRDFMLVTNTVLERGEVRVTYGSFLEYFTSKNENSSPIIQIEKKWLIEEEGFDLYQAYYFAFPYFIGGKLKGLFFLFAKNKVEAEQIERQQAVIAEIITAKML